MKSDAPLLAAQGVLLSGSAKSIHNLHMTEEAGRTYRLMHVERIAEVEKRRVKKSNAAVQHGLAWINPRPVDLLSVLKSACIDRPTGGQ